MKIRNLLLLAAFLSASALRAEPALTIYNQRFAVVRDTVPLDLKPGVNDVNFAETTAHLEPDSVILRDPTGATDFQILEQNYRNDPVSQELLLSLFEGKTIDFFVPPDRTIKGKIIRSGYVRHSSDAMQRYGQQYAMTQMALSYGSFYGGPAQPIIEVDGKLQFSLPGQPIFPTLGDDTILKPTLSWKLESDKAATLNAELSYVTGGMSWQADYNLIAAEDSDLLDIVGWVTIDNQSGKSFDNAKIKLMAGDVSKIQDQNRGLSDTRDLVMQGAAGPSATEKAFDEYHLYTLARPTTLLDRETKQVEFIHAAGVKSAKIFAYDGRDKNTKVAVMREFNNSAANHLGIPLPEGRMRFYKRDDDKQVEFIGENMIDHTPKDENVRVYVGNAFDLDGERIQTDSHVDDANRQVDEAFQITLRNHKSGPVEIRVTERFYRNRNWEITQQSDPFQKTSAQQGEFRVQVKPDEQKVITYRVHYTW